MKKKFLNIILSKRFLAFILSLIVFTILVIVTKWGPIEIATGLTAIGAVYIINETVRKSDEKIKE